MGYWQDWVFMFAVLTYTTHTQDGYSPLYCASQEGHDEVVEMLLHASAKVDLWTEVNNAEALAIVYFLFLPQHTSIG